MSHDFYLIFRDAIITIFQIWCFTLLAINEKGKENKNFKNFFILSISTVLVILSYFSTPILLKLTITVLLVVMLGQFVYQCSKIKLFLYGIIMVVTTYCSEMLVIQTWNLFNEPVYSQNMVYDDFVIEVIIMANADHMVCRGWRYIYHGAGRCQQQEVGCEREKSLWDAREGNFSY